MVGDEQVGVVTSGTLSPTLGKNIALGLLRSGLSTPGTKLEADLRGKRVSATVVPLPFYKRAK